MKTAYLITYHLARFLATLLFLASLIILPLFVAAFQ